MLRNITSRRLYSSVYSTVKVKKRNSVKDLFYRPVFKSLFLTLVLGSAAVEATKNRKELESLRAAYAARFGVLENAIQKVRRKEPIDIAAELKLANSLTRNKYNSVKDVQMDEQFESFLKMAEEDSTYHSVGDLDTRQEEPDVKIDSIQQKVTSAVFL